jgi:hypothetical protein
MLLEQLETHRLLILMQQSVEGKAVEMALETQERMAVLAAVQ